MGRYNMSPEDVRRKNAEHRARVKRRNSIIILVCVALLFVTVMLSVNLGYSKYSMADIVRILFGGGSDLETMIIYDVRMPRVVIAMLVGAGLAISGCIIQGVTRNDLAEPGLLGINAGAGMAVVLFLMFSGVSTLMGKFTLPFVALTGAGVVAILIFMVANRRGSSMTPLRLVLSGVALQAGITALTTVLVVRLADDQYEFYANWSAGTIWASTWDYVLILLPWLLILIPAVLSKARTLDVMALGDGTAKGLGIDTAREGRLLFAAAVGLAASCVAVGGSISFVGLLVPHLCRKLVGPRHSVLIPACVLVGAALVAMSDLVARIIIQPDEIPAGVVVAVIGAPYFLYLLTKRRS